MRSLQKLSIPRRSNRRTVTNAGRFCRNIRYAVAFCLCLLLTIFTHEPLCPAFEYPPLQPLGGEISDFEARLQLARLLSDDDQRINEALEHYRRLLAQHPDDLAVRLELAEVLLRCRRFEAAVSELEHLRKSRPDPDKRITTLLARVYIASGNNQAALELLEPQYRRDPKNKELGRILAQNYNRLGRTQDALSIIVALNKALPRDSDLLVELADLEAAAGHMEGCRTHFSEAIKVAENPEALRLKYAERMNLWGDFYGIEAIYQEHLSIHPQDMEVRRKLAAAMVGAQRYEEAESIYRMLLLEGYPKFAVLGDLAKLHTEAKNNPTAIAAINEILDINSNSQDVFIDQRTEGNYFYIRVAFDRAVEPMATFTLENPARLVFDLKGPVMTKGEIEVPVKQAGISNIRLGKHPDKTRLVVHAADSRVPKPWMIFGDRTLHLVFISDAGVPADLQPETIAGANIDILTQAFRLKAQVLSSMGQWNQAVDLEKHRVNLPGERIDALLALGRLYLQKGDDAAAAKWFEQAFLASPESIPVRFYYTGLKQVGSNDFLNQLLDVEHFSPMDLVQWGRLYSENGRYAPAIACYRKALAIDPACFPARLLLAETLAYHQSYAESIATFEPLASDFPKNRKILVSWARVLSWAKFYDEALNVYQQIQSHNPQDPLPKIEMARTAAWAKKMDQAMAFYGSLWQPSVDRRVAEALKTVAPDKITDAAKVLVEETQRDSEKDTIYQGYEHFIEKLSVIEKEAPAPDYYPLKKIAAELWGIYKIQKIAWQESRAKWLAWNRQFPAALAAYESLIETRPGNQEALFDFAQVQCALGLCDRESDTYKELLRLEPFHTLADRALQRQQIRSRMSASAGFNFWHEEGRDDIARITRFRYDVALDIPLTCRYRLTAKGHLWNEDPESGDKSYEAHGFSLGFNGVWGPHVTGAMEWTRKNYSERSLGETDTGLVNLWYRLDSGTRIGLGYDRIDELYNDFGIRRGIQSSSGWVAVETLISREWDMRGRARYKHYNDDNNGKHYTLSTGYMLTDHPRLFKITVSGDYRDTREENIYRFENGRLVDIIHPYWTPTNHGAAAIILEWYHDLAEDFFCGARQHFYRFALTLGTETESNHSAALEGEWRFEFRPRWTLHVKGLVHRSREWDAEGLWTQLQYRF